MAAQGSSPVGQIIREYRKTRGITQKQLADRLGVEARTLRMYENGERSLENISDLRRIADLLAIDPTELGLAARRDESWNAQRVRDTVEHVGDLLLQARLVEARTTLENLLRHFPTHQPPDDALLLRELVRAHCLAGHVQAMVRRTRECENVLRYYQEAAGLARLLTDPTLLLIARSYQADVQRRRGESGVALATLEKASIEAGNVGSEARGLHAMLQARTLLSNHDSDGFVREMARAEKLALALPADADTLAAQFSPGTMYAEFAAGCAMLGDFERSQHYLKLAEQHLPSCHLWSMLLSLTYAEALVHTGAIADAMPQLIEVAHLAQMYGHQRLLERLYRLQYYLDDQAALLHQASRSLSSVLHGPVE
jgi:transcriptional regulator with XRE-family HTH domain